jgi:hypothetical protein
MNIFLKSILYYLLKNLKKKGVKMFRLTYDNEKGSMVLELDFYDEPETITILASDIKLENDRISWGEVTTTSKQGFIKLALITLSIFKNFKIDPDGMRTIREVFKIVK